MLSFKLRTSIFPVIPNMLTSPRKTRSHLAMRLTDLESGSTTPIMLKKDLQQLKTQLLTAILSTTIFLLSPIFTSKLLLSLNQNLRKKRNLPLLTPKCKLKELKTLVIPRLILLKWTSKNEPTLYEINMNILFVFIICMLNSNSVIHK